MKPLVLIIFMWIFAGCKQAQNAGAPKETGAKGFYEVITKQFATMDRLQQSGGYDSLNAENDTIISLLKQYKTDLLNLSDSLDYDLIYLAKSADKNLALVSWDMRTGGTMIDFTTMAVFTTPDSVSTKMLLDTADETMPYTFMHYNKVHTITTAEGKKIYLAWGNGQGSTAIPWQELRAFAIENGRLVEPAIFPDGTSKISVDFDLHDFEEKQEVPVINVKDGGRTVEVPLKGPREGFSGKYETYIFNGKVFIPK